MKMLKERQKLFYKGKSCEFVEYDEVYGMVWIKFKKPFKIKKESMFNPKCEIYQICVSIEEVIIDDKRTK